MSETKDCNGNVLHDGDSVHLIKDLTSKAFKRGGCDEKHPAYRMIPPMLNVGWARSRW